MKQLLLVLCAILMMGQAEGREPSSPNRAVRIGIAGLSHSHVVPLLRDLEREDLEIVGIAERDTALSRRYAERFGYDLGLVYTSLEEMLEKCRPEGVVTFTSIHEHLEVVEYCAPRGIHVMVEKPMAVSVDHAMRMSQLAEKHGVMLLTNYETTWYPSTYEGRNMVLEGKLGELRKVIVYDGHTGPREIRVNEEFLDWLTDPVLNGGGAVMDFGCYGANLLTWLMNGQKPLSVWASLKQYKPEVYPEVDDDATMVLTYPHMEAIIHASWNWPFNRKDMHLYGTSGYAFLDDATHIRYRFHPREKEQRLEAKDSSVPFADGFAYFTSVIRGQTEVAPSDLSALENNVTVVEILEAAIESNKTGRTIVLDP
jgi:predicted dehydrogenase